MNDPVFYGGDSIFRRRSRRIAPKQGRRYPKPKARSQDGVREPGDELPGCVLGLEKLKQCINVLHIVGGGSKTVFLNQLTASVLDREVVAGPSEATAIGNIMAQAKASGAVKDSAEMAEVIRTSFGVESYAPRDTEQAMQAYERYTRIIESQKGSDK